MAMWEPFTQPARRAIVRAQEVAQMFASSRIGVEHIAFALAEADDDVGHALAQAIDREPLRALLGPTGTAPREEMVFDPDAKRTIEKAFENARRLDHHFIGVAHLALGLLDTGGPALRAGVDVAGLRAELTTAAKSDAPS